jgi:acetyl esterase
MIDHTKYLVLYLLITLASSTAFAAEFEDRIRASFEPEAKPTEVFVCRETPAGNVEAHYFKPDTPRVDGLNPCVVFIHGGGWRGGNPTGTYRWSRYLAEHGVSAFTVKYRLAREKDGVGPSRCLEDAKTAIRWIRSNAEKFGIDPDKIAVAGNSAGGHLASALATIDGFNDPSDDLAVSCRPNLLMLASPVMDNGPTGYGHDRVADYWESFSPVHNLNHQLPSTLVLMGDRDPLIKMASVEKFGRAVEASGSEFEWFVFPGRGHGLFSQKKSYLTPELMHIYYAFHSFLARHDYIAPPLAAGDEVRTLIREDTLSPEAPAAEVIDSKPKEAMYEAPDNSRPNLIVILADDMGVTDIGAFHELYPGAPEAQLAHNYTPALDQLARQGVRFTRAYSATWCAPSRQMLLSGQWVNRRNAYGHPWIGNQLRQAGYATCMIGKSHGSKPIAKAYRNMDPATAEFDDGFWFNGGSRRSYLEEGETFPGRRGLVPFTFTAKGGEYLTDVYTDHAVEFIENNADRPFMLYLPYNAPHGPLDGKPEDMRKLFPDTFADASDEDIISGPLMARTDKLEAMHFAAMVYRMDLGIGRIMKTLKDEGVADNTLIIFTSDNGRTFGYGDWLSDNHPFTGHKSNMLEGGIRVPFIVWSADLAKSKQSGKLYDGLVSLADIAPTLMGQAQDNPYAHPTDGANLMPYLSGEEAPLAGRTYFCALAGSPSKMTGIDGFTGKTYEGRVMHSVYVRDDQKILRWRPQHESVSGAVYSQLADASGKQNPAEILKEQTPVAGKVPAKGQGHVLYEQMMRFIEINRDQLVPTWTGDPHEFSWQSIEDE